MHEVMASATATSLPVQSTSMIASSTFSQVLQSDSVRRLFNQPNIVIHAIPRTDSPTAFRMVSPKSFINNTNETNGEQKSPCKPEMSIQVFNPSNKDSSEEENLLPSKNSGKSEILLVPIVRKRKECGHFEPCESLVCNVSVLQYEDEKGIIPLIAVNIGDGEIDSLVTKHCKNKKCDALSIDHNCCRRASVNLYYCDKSIICDICGITFESRKAHLDHKKCRRKYVSQQNIATPIEIFKFKMRERELQIIETAKLKRSADYLDPVFGFSRTMEALTKNDELIITPKLPPLQSNILRQNVTLANNGKINNSNNNNYNNNSNIRIKSILGNRKTQASESNQELTSEMISSIILSCKNSINMDNKNEKNYSSIPKQIKLSDHLNGATVKIVGTSSFQKQQQIKVSPVSSNIVSSFKNQQQPHMKIVKAESQLTSATSNSKQTKIIASNCVDTEYSQESNVNSWIVSNQSSTNPHKVVSIVELKSKPSLLHQTQGVPKFCVVPDTSVRPLTPISQKSHKKKEVSKKQAISTPPMLLKLLPNTVLNSSKFRPLQPALSGTSRNVDTKLGAVILAKKQKARKRSRKKLLKKGKFRCTHCPKRFSSIDYCKIHIAKHENNPGFFCRLCERGFLNKYVMTKHVNGEHKAGETRCEMCNSILPSMHDLLKHMECPDTKLRQQCNECSESFDSCNKLDIHMRREHGYLICALCKRQITKSKIKRHLMLEHSISKNRSENSLDKLSYPPGENDKLSEVVVISEDPIEKELVVKSELVNISKSNKIQVDCLARNRSVRRRNSKEFFICSVCDRRFENEKQFQIHLANNPMKFTLCPNCGKKFHRKSECTEHSKTCLKNSLPQVEQTSKRRKSSLMSHGSISKNDHDILHLNSIDQKQNAALNSNKCKKLKLNEEKIIQKEAERSENILKITVETKIVNGFKSNSSDCLKKLKIIKKENTVQISESYQVEHHKNQDVSIQMNSNESMIFDKATAISNIIQDHNYQALQ